MKKGIPISETTKSDAEVVAELNNRIAKLSMYGIRQEIVQQPSYLLSWSNGAKAWYVAYGYGVMQPGEKVPLDANQFLAPYRKAILDRIIDKLDYLPLYKMSFEAKTRGEYATN